MRRETDVRHHSTRMIPGVVLTLCEVTMKRHVFPILSDQECCEAGFTHRDIGTGQ